MSTPVESTPCAPEEAPGASASASASSESAEGSESSDPCESPKGPKRFSRQALESGLQESFVIIYDGQMGEFEKSLAKLNTKAAKYKLDPIEIVSRKPRLFQQVTEVDDRGRVFYASHAIASPSQARGERPHVLVRATQIDLRFPVVKLAGWRVIGMMEPLQAGTLLFAFSHEASDAQLLEPYRMKPIGCDHCGSKRKRSLGFVLQEEATGKVAQVGSTCLKDYTGLDPAALLFLARLAGRLLSDEGDEGRFGRGRRSRPTLEYLADVVFCAQSHGFFSVGKARDAGVEPTYSEALTLDHALQHDKELAAKYRASQDACQEQARQILDWVQALPEDSADAFATNVAIVLSQELLDLSERRQLATAAAAWSLYRKAQAPAEAAQTVPSTHLGSVGDKLKTTLKLLRSTSFDTAYGVLFILVFEDAQHRIVVWKTGSPPQTLTAVDSVGACFSAQFRIKAHSDYKGTLQTEVTHLKVLELLPGSAVQADSQDLPAQAPVALAA